MKKLTAFLCALLLCAGFAMLGGCADMSADDGKLQVISTVFAPYDFAREVGGVRVNAQMLVPPGTETHAYEPTARDLIAVQNCDVFIYVGGESDAWVQTLLDAIDTDGVQLVTLMDCVELLPEEHEHDHDHGESVYDEHVWTSPANAVRITEKIAAALKTADPDGAGVYDQNSADYVQKLHELDGAFSAVVAQSKRQTLVMADRFPLRYFAEQYGLSYHAAFAGCAHESEPSAATVAALIDTVKAQDIPVVLMLELSSGRMAQTVSDETGAAVRTFHACHNVTSAEMEAGATYLSLMYQNCDVLKEALG